MPRPVGADAAATREKIRSAAAGLFAAHGPDGVSIRDVVGAAGVSLAMVHHHFGSKDDLYKAVVDAMYQELAALRGILLALPPSPDLVARVVVETFRFARAHQPAIRLTLREILATGELPAHRREHFLFPLLSAVVAIFPAHDPSEIRLRAQSLVFLIVRYALATPAEIARIAGVHPADALARAEAHLVSLARALLQKAEPCTHESLFPSPTVSRSAPGSPTSSGRSSTSTASSSSPRSRRPPKSR
jgi:AcrR family transcriptional regulator